MDITYKTIELLQIEADFTVKNRTPYSKELTVFDLINTILLDEGISNINLLFKGHELSKIRKALTDLFFEYPKPSPSSTWYLHILSINGLKKCPCCAEVKELNYFSKNKAMKTSGVDSWCLLCTKAYREINSDKLKKTKAAHQKNNPAQYAQASAKRRAAKLCAVPTWADLEVIQNIYENCPVGYHVDHWAPLQGELVCGLHVEHNLQYVPAKENISKSNKFSDTDVYYGY